MNSYKRLVPGYEAPCYLAWSASNRSALIRIPAARGQSTQVGSALPTRPATPTWSWLSVWPPGWTSRRASPRPGGHREHLRHECRRPKSSRHRLSARLLEEAIHALEADPLVLDTLGEHVAANYIEGKRKEWEEYRTRVSSWEREKYIINY